METPIIRIVGTTSGKRPTISPTNIYLVTVSPPPLHPHPQPHPHPLLHRHPYPYPPPPTSPPPSLVELHVFSVPVLRSLANATSTPLPRSGRLLLAPASSRGAEGRCVGGVGEGGLRGGSLRGGRVSLPVGEAAQGVGVRAFGVIDSVQNKIISRNAAKQGGWCLLPALSV